MVPGGKGVIDGDSIRYGEVAREGDSGARDGIGGAGQWCKGWGRWHTSGDSGKRDGDGSVRDEDGGAGEWTEAQGRGQWRVRSFFLPCLCLVRTLFTSFS